MHVVLSSLRRPRHPLARALSLLLGAALIGVLLVFSLMVAVVLLIVGCLLLAWRQWKHGRPSTKPTDTHTSHEPDVLEGEYVVIHQGRPVMH